MATIVFSHKRAKTTAPFVVKKNNGCPMCCSLAFFRNLFALSVSIIILGYLFNQWYPTTIVRDKAYVALSNVLDASRTYALSTLANQSGIIAVARAADYLTNVLDTALSVVVATAYGTSDLADDHRVYYERATKLVHDWTSVSQTANKLVNRERMHVESLIRELPELSKLLMRPNMDITENEYAKKKLANINARWHEVQSDFLKLVEDCNKLVYDNTDLRMFVEERIADYHAQITSIGQGKGIERELFVFSVMLLLVAAPSTIFFQLSAGSSIALSGVATGVVDVYKTYIADPEQRQILSTMIDFYSGQSLLLLNFSSALKSYELVLDNILNQVTYAGVDIHSFVSCKYEEISLGANHCLDAFLADTIRDLKKVEECYSHYQEDEAGLNNLKLSTKKPSLPDTDNP